MRYLDLLPPPAPAVPLPPPPVYLSGQRREYARLTEWFSVREVRRLRFCRWLYQRGRLCDWLA